MGGMTDMGEIKTVAVIGAGALGVMYGAHLTKKLGREHVLIAADDERVSRYKENGFFCNGEPCDFCYVSGKDSQIKADLILFSVKFTAMEEAVEQARRLVHPETLMLSLINGISSEEILKEAFGAEHVLYCVAQGMDATREGNQVRYKNMGLLLIGDPSRNLTDRLNAVAGFFDRTEIPYQIPEDIQYALWDKLMLNVGVNQVVAVFETTYGGIQIAGETRETMIRAMREAGAVATAEGTALGEENISRWLTLLDSLDPEGMPSLRQDTKAGRKTEVELFAGTICRLGKKHHISTPVNDWLYEQIRKLEQRQ